MLRRDTHNGPHTFCFLTDDSPESRAALPVVLAHYCRRTALPFDPSHNALDVLVWFGLDDDETVDRFFEEAMDG